MAKLEDLISQVADPALRVELAREVEKLKAQKKFGLVFEEHIPELVQLPSLPVRPGARVVKRGGASNEIFFVRDATNGSKVRIARERDGQEEVIAVADLVTVKKFGEPIIRRSFPSPASCATRRDLITRSSTPKTSTRSSFCSTRTRDKWT